MEDVKDAVKNIKICAFKLSIKKWGLTTKRQIIKIDEEKCTGCGECVPNCPEGALQIIDPGNVNPSIDKAQ